MLNRRRLNAIPLSALAITVFSLAGCNRQTNADAAGAGPTDVKVEEVNAYGMVQVDHPEQFLLAAVEQRPAVDELQVTGVVAPDVNRSVPVLSLAGGRAVEIRAKLGDVVTKGQVLLVIDSPDVSQAFSDYQKFQADEVFAQQQLPRAQDLFAKGAIARQDLEAAENSEHKAQVDVRTAKQHIAVLGADHQQPHTLGFRPGAHFRIDCGAERNQRHRRSFHGQFPQPLHHCRPFAGLGALRCLRE